MHQDAFKKGIDDWKTTKTWEVVCDMFAAITAIASSITLACVAPPAGVAGIRAGAAALGAAASGAEKVVSLFQKFAKVVQAIEEIFNKIIPYLEKMKEVVDAIKNVIAIVEKQGFMENFGNEEIGKLKLPGELYIFRYYYSLLILVHPTLTVPFYLVLAFDARCFG